jgi:hypothetical protein
MQWREDVLRAPNGALTARVVKIVAVSMEIKMASVAGGGWLRMTIGRKIYALIGLGFVGLLTITFLDSRE